VNGTKCLDDSITPAGRNDFKRNGGVILTVVLTDISPSTAPPIGAGGTSLTVSITSGFSITFIGKSVGECFLITATAL